jgi:hypothetical protein
MATDGERRILSEITRLANKIRESRRRGANRQSGEIEALEAATRAKWDELRLLRAGPVNNDPPPRYSRSSRQ